VNTSMTTLISLGALFFFGPVATQDFALTLIIGVITGTYSSIAVATPLLVAYERWAAKRS
jgi:preprotein translocase subunit SecF